MNPYCVICLDGLNEAVFELEDDGYFACPVCGLGDYQIEKGGEDD